MAKKMNVLNLNVSERGVNVFVENNEQLIHKAIQPEGRMLADSEHLAFIYILDVEDDFLYLSFPETVWSELNTAINQNLPLFLHVNNEVRIPLTQFHDELNYFIANIEENSNYGNSMVKAVSQAFGTKR